MTSFQSRDPIRIAIIGLIVIVLGTLAALNAKSLPIIGGGTGYQALFSEAAGLKSGDPVTIAGVDAGRVTDVELDGDRVLVSFRVDDAWVGDRTSASIQIRTLLGSKSLALDPQGADEMDSDQPIPLDRTASPYDVAEALSGLSRNLEEIDTQQLGQSLRTLSDTFRGTPPEVRGALDGLSRLSTTIASRDQEIAHLLANTRNVTGVLASRNVEIGKLLSDGNLLLAEIQRRRAAVSALLSGTRQLGIELRGVVADNSATLRPALEQLDRVAAVLQRNQDNLDRTLQLEAVFVRLFTNALGNGRWFDNYICGLLPPPIGPINPGGC